MKLENKIRRLVGRAVQEYQMIAPGDSIAVGVSGGKDSFTLLEVLDGLKKRAPIQFELSALVIDQGFVDFQVEVLEEYLGQRGIPFRVESVDTQALEEQYGKPGGSFCSFCARNRRGHLYRAAREMGCNKIALGHHRDDMVETLMMNMFFNGSMKGMPARLEGTGLGQGMELIRPLVYVPEEWIRDYAEAKAFPLISCACPTCGTHLQKRQWVKRLLGELEAEVPGVKKNLLNSMQNVEAQQLLLFEDAKRTLADRLLGAQEV